MAMTLQTSAVESTPAAAVRPARVRGHIRSDAFDTTLLFAPALTGLAVAALAGANPLLFPALLFADLWLLGYHHVVATYTRLAFDLKSLRQNRTLAVDLLIAVLAATVALCAYTGAWVVASAFMYLQWFHYMRQSYGLSRMFFRTTPEGREAGARDVIANLVIYMVPIYGIAHRSATMGGMFLGLPVKTLVLPDGIVAALGVAAAVATTAWVLRVGQAMRRGTLQTAYEGYVLSHVALFMAAYVLIDDANVGWLAINVWHNFQYVLVVWMTNAKRWSGGVDPEARFISSISQPGRVAAYFGACLAISTGLYFLLGQVTTLTVGGGLAATAGVYMGINFHHYIVDALIWKRRHTAAQRA
jgi:hypothetical protein